jgi:NAD(P)-dependent dehydrogenase (short-subunit alcohol dehydrogenase family)
MSAGSIGALGPVVDIDADQWWQAVAVDLRGTMLTVQAALRSMLPLHSGLLITVYGNLGDRGTPNVSAFSAAKAGVARLTETVANEVQGTGITVIGLHPGFVRTPMTEHLAWSDEGQRWLPTFRPHAEKNWMSGDAAAAMVEEIMAGRADSLGGRILYAGDDITTLVRRTADAPDLRRLRVQP